MSRCNECSCCQVLPGAERSLTAALAEVARLRGEVEARRASEAMLAASLKRVDAEVERLRGEVERLEALFQRAHGVHHGWVARAQEADRLRAALADTPETLTRVACAFNGRGSDSSFVRPGDLDGARAVLAALRARAGVP
jgi:methylphosphotriester-DNA--protein-cysteine methyltransferase